MPDIAFEHVNWLAVIVSALTIFMIGGIWYGAAFAKLWQRLNGYSDEKLKEIRASRPPPVFFGVMLAAYAVLAAALAILARGAGVTTAAGGAALSLSNHIASDKPMSAFVLDTSCQLVYLLTAGAIIGAWQSAPV